jgi:hypothetical protein
VNRCGKPLVTHQAIFNGRSVTMGRATSFSAEERAMSCLFQILAGETPEERRSDLFRLPTGAPTPMVHAPHGVPGEPDPADRRRLRSSMVAVGVAGLLVLGGYGLAEGQTTFQCNPQYSFCNPGYGGYPGGFGYPGGGHRGWGGLRGGGWNRGGGAYEANFGGLGGSGAGHGGGGGGG